MGIKVVENKMELRKPEFPKLMRSRGSLGRVVLFTSSMVGTVLVQGAAEDPVGFQYTQWSPDSFVDYEGSLTLSNEG